MPMPLRDLTGQRFTRLVVVERVAWKPGEPRWLVECDCGARKTVAGCNLKSGSVQSCGCLSRDTAAALGLARAGVNRKAVVGYGGAHDRVRRVRGSARAHACHDCGATAEDWSYAGADPEEQAQTKTNARYGFETTLTYSLDPSYYVPRCKPCHAAHDDFGKGRRGVGRAVSSAV